MADTLFLIFNHQLTREQEADASAALGVKRIIELPADLQELWGNIPPDLPALNDYLWPLREWLLSRAAPGDYVLIQGDFGACCILVSFSIAKGYLPIYSTTRRVASEEMQSDGRIRLVHHFEHRIFRRYGL
ncbi:MAG: CRISPR-associated protein Csx20 [Syntrophobacteraceae bacterium]|nr:CRISPR-associated protein Csx20 [Syntrophobacteraceae bacterium]